MAKLGFHILMAWTKLNAALPFWLLYLKSDVFYFVVYHLARYKEQDQRLFKIDERKFSQSVMPSSNRTAKAV